MLMVAPYHHSRPSRTWESPRHARTGLRSRFQWAFWWTATTQSGRGVQAAYVRRPRGAAEVFESSALVCAPAAEVAAAESVWAGTGANARHRGQSGALWRGWTRSAQNQCQQRRTEWESGAFQHARGDTRCAQCEGRWRESRIVIKNAQAMFTSTRRGDEAH
jgi:hypothetical protein